jgi:DNA-binding protein YbaB
VEVEQAEKEIRAIREELANLEVQGVVLGNIVVIMVVLEVEHQAKDTLVEHLL